MPHLRHIEDIRMFLASPGEWQPERSIVEDIRRGPRGLLRRPDAADTASDLTAISCTAAATFVDPSRFSAPFGR